MGKSVLLKDISKKIKDAVKALNKVTDPEDVLKIVNSDEISTKLVGAERQKYLNALDVVQGKTRDTDLGYIKKDFFHGSPNEFDEFDMNRAKVGTQGKGIYFADETSKDIADGYGRKGDVKKYRIKDFDKMGSFDKKIDEKDIAAIKKHADPDVFKYLENNYDLEPGSSLRNTFRRISAVHMNKSKTDPLSKIADEMGISGLYTPEREATVYKTSNIRSADAAFDKRFADSAKLLAGAGALQRVNTDMSPLDDIKKGFNTYEEIKGALAQKFAEQFDLTKDKSSSESMGQILSMLADPLNIIAGPAGVAVGAAQALATDDQSDAIKRRLSKLKGDK